jgi:hypothetical protein
VFKAPNIDIKLSCAGWRSTAIEAGIVPPGIQPETFALVGAARQQLPGMINRRRALFSQRQEFVCAVAALCDGPRFALDSPVATVEQCDLIFFSND